MSEIAPWFSDTPREGESVSDVDLDEIVGAYYTHNPAGGRAHVVFDEEAIEDSTITYCITYAISHGDWLCAGILGELLKRHPMTREQIVKGKRGRYSTNPS